MIKQGFKKLRHLLITAKLLYSWDRFQAWTAKSNQFNSYKNVIPLNCVDLKHPLS